MNAMPPKLPKHGRVKAKYNATPTAKEMAYHEWLMETYPCLCGCGQSSTVVHHPLTRHRDQRWRRDHEFVVPMNGFCHFDLHRVGSEQAFDPSQNYADRAANLRAIAMEMGKL